MCSGALGVVRLFRGQTIGQVCDSEQGSPVGRLDRSSDVFQVRGLRGDQTRSPPGPPPAPVIPRSAADVPLALVIPISVFRGCLADPRGITQCAFRAVLLLMASTRAVQVRPSAVPPQCCPRFPQFAPTVPAGVPLREQSMCRRYILHFYVSRRVCVRKGFALIYVQCWYRAVIQSGWWIVGVCV